MGPLIYTLRGEVDSRCMFERGSSCWWSGARTGSYGRSCIQPSRRLHRHAQLQPVLSPVSRGDIAPSPLVNSLCSPPGGKGTADLSVQPVAHLSPFQNSVILCTHCIYPFPPSILQGFVQVHVCMSHCHLLERLRTAQLRVIYPVLGTANRGSPGIKEVGEEDQISQPPRSGSSEWLR